MAMVPAVMSSRRMVRRSAPGPYRVAALDEGARPLAGVGAAEHPRLPGGLKLLGLAEVGARSADELLGGAQGEWPVPSDALSHPQCGVHHVGGRDDDVHQAKRERA